MTEQSDHLQITMVFARNIEKGRDGVMNLNKIEIERKQKVERFGALLLLVLAGFFVFVCTPVYVLASTNIMISGTAFPIFWDFIQDVNHFLYYWVAFSFLIYLSARYTVRSTRLLLLVYAGCSFLKYFLSLMVDNLIHADWTSMNYHLYYMMIDVLGDWLLMSMVFLLCYVFFERVKEKKKTISFDFSGVLQLSNPVLKCTLLVSLMLMVCRLLSRFLYDVNYGAPQSRADLIGMIVYYFGDVLSGIVGYFLVFLIISRIYLKDEEAARRDS